MNGNFKMSKEEINFIKEYQECLLKTGQFIKRDMKTFLEGEIERFTPFEFMKVLMDYFFEMKREQTEIAKFKEAMEEKEEMDKKLVCEYLSGVLDAISEEFEETEDMEGPEDDEIIDEEYEVKDTPTKK